MGRYMGRLLDLELFSALCYEPPFPWGAFHLQDYSCFPWEDMMPVLGQLK